MTKQKTLYQIILDCSGSMSNCAKETIEGYNEQVQFLKGLEEKFPDQEIEVSLTTFNYKVTSVMEQSAPSHLKTLDSSHYRPQGSTAMLDAIGTSVQRLENKFHACNVQTPTTVVVLILTDGAENASKLFTFTDIRNTIKRLEATGQWTFSFLGADFNIDEMREQLSIKESNSFAFEKSTMRNDMWDRVNHSLEQYMNKKEKGEKNDSLF